MFEFEVTFLFFIFLFFVARYFLFLTNSKELDYVSMKLENLRILLIMKEYSKIYFFYKKNSHDLTLKTILSSFFKGRKIYKKVIKIQSLILQEKKILHKNHETKWLFFTRVFLVLFLSFFSRWVIYFSLDIEYEKNFFILLLVTFFCFLLSLFFLELYTKKPWFYNKNIRPLGSFWLDLYLSDSFLCTKNEIKQDCERFLYKKLKNFSTEEQKDLFLEDFAWQQNLKYSTHEKKIMDVLPFLEVLAYGVPTLFWMSDCFFLLSFALT